TRSRAASSTSGSPRPPRRGNGAGEPSPSPSTAEGPAPSAPSATHSSVTRSWAALVAASVAVAALAASTTSPAAAPALDLALGRAVRAPGIAASQTAAIAIDLRSGETLFSQNGSRGLLPASVEKLSVSFTALHVLGPRFRFRTELVGKGLRSGRTWR